MARKPDDRRECFAAIGEALTEWSYMELSLAKLFCAAASAIDDEAAYRAFWTALSFEGKLKMTDAAMQVVGDDSIREQWSELLDSLRSKAKKRNEIAHGTVMTFHGEHSTKTRHVPYLWSDTHEILETEPGPPKNAMSIDQIEEAAAQFKDASEAIAATTREILRLRAKDR
jgi:hypothetical protein